MNMLYNLHKGCCSECTDDAAQYNTCFWTLIQQDGRTPAEAQQLLKVSRHAALWYISDKLIAVLCIAHDCLRSIIYVRILTCPWHLQGLKMPAGLKIETGAM